MTYREAYMECETLEDLRDMVSSDIATAFMINTDRIGVIKDVAEEVANLKFGEKISI